MLNYVRLIKTQQLLIKNIKANTNKHEEKLLLKKV